MHQRLPKTRWGPGKQHKRLHICVMEVSLCHADELQSRAGRILLVNSASQEWLGLGKFSWCGGY